MGRSSIDESVRSEEATHPTVAEAAADVGVLVGDTQPGEEPAEVLPLFRV